MRENIIKPSVALLPMEDIYNELYIKYDFIKKTETINDTKHVSNELASNIAIAYKDPVTNAVADRETIKNAMQLGGISANQYVTNEAVADSLNIVNNSNEVYSQEILNLRDELYQIKEILTKRGFIKDSYCYNGFQDNFLSNDKKYLYNKASNTKVICKVKTPIMASDVRTFVVDNPDEINIGDWIVIYKPREDIYFLVSVINKDNITGSITIDKGISNLDTDTEIYKTFGDYYKGTFSFSDIQQNVISNKPMFAAQVADTDLKDYYITSPSTGYAVSVKIPDDSIGAVTDFTIKGKAHGNTGDLVCYIINAEDASKFQNFGQFMQDGKIVGKSQYVAAKDCLTLTDIVFNFIDPKTEKAPILTNKNYYFIVESLNANTYGDYWDIKMSNMHNSVGTVAVPNFYTTYKFKEISFLGQTASDAFYIDDNIDGCSMYFRLVTNYVEDEEELPHESGLYTANFTLPEPMLASKARLSLRINREGGLYIKDTEGPCMPGHIFTFGVNSDLSDYNLGYGNGLIPGDTAIIGTTAGTVSFSGDQKLIINKGLYLNENALLYRMGFNIQIKASLEECNSLTGFNKSYTNKHLDTSLNQEIPYAMGLKAIIPDGPNKESALQSDRLLFETDFDRDDHNLPKYVNNFEVQIKWSSNFKENQLREFKDLVGRIISLNLILDKTL